MHVVRVRSVEFSQSDTYIRPAPNPPPRLRTLQLAGPRLRALTAVVILLLYVGVVIGVGVYTLEQLARLVAMLASVRPG